MRSFILTLLVAIPTLLTANYVHADCNWSYEAALTELRAPTSLRAKFIQDKRVAALSRPLRSNGTFLYLANRGILWRTEAPFPTSFALSSAGIFRQSASGKESILVKDNPALERITTLFLSLFNADRSELEARFTTQFSCREESWQLRLEPRDPLARKAIREIDLIGDAFVNELILREQSGNETSIRFFDTRENIQPSDEELVSFE